VKILHIVPWYEPAWNAGGTASAVASLCKAMVKQGDDITVYTTNDAGQGKRLDCPLGQLINRDGVKTWYFACDFPFKSKAAFYSRDLCQKISETMIDFDLVHVSATRHAYGLSVYRNHKINKIPYLISPHASLMEAWINKIGSRLLKLPYLWLIESAIIRHATAIHFLSSAERQASQAYSYGKSSFIVPNGIPCELFAPSPDQVAARRQSLAANNRTILLHMGRIHPQKNIHLTLEALAQLKQKNILANTLYVLAGPDSDKTYKSYLCRRIEEYNLSGYIRWVGPVPPTDISTWYAACDLLVLPSQVEGISMSVIESLACGLPVLLSDKAANSTDITGDPPAGFVVRESVQSLFATLHYILKYPHILKQLSANAVILAHQKYNIHNIAQMMKQAYNDILANTKNIELQWN